MKRTIGILSQLGGQMRLKQVTACLALALSACAQTNQPVGNHSYQVGHVAAQQAEAQAPGFQFAPWVSDAERAEFLRQYNSDPVIQSGTIPSLDHTVIVRIAP